MSLTTQQIIDTAANFANAAFVQPGVTASLPLDQIQGAAQAVDAFFDTTLNNAVAEVGGGFTVSDGLGASMVGPISTAPSQLKTLLACCVLMKRNGVI
jgi:hypothetical protein